MNKNTLTMVDKVNQYIEYRRSLGYKLNNTRSQLLSFARYAERCAPSQPLTAKLALQWAAEPKTGCRDYLAQRLNAVRSFARHLVAFEPRTEIPPTGAFGPSYVRRAPHIYTKHEVAALMQAAVTARPANKVARMNALRNATIIGLLACTGMRIGEILALENGDVDLTHAIITVRCSKNLPVRLVPITDCTVEHLRNYQRSRDDCFGPSEELGAFIHSPQGGHLTRPRFTDVFRGIVEQAGLKSQSASGRPLRLYDFRHTFACNHLLRAYREGRSIDDAVHMLSVYLGHANLKCTYWYLTGIPVLFEQCCKRLKGWTDRQRNGGRT